jgi:orotate phosphoribosyltransferase
VSKALDLPRLLAERKALLEGHFRLSSGRHSDRFIQKFRILEDPALVEPIARRLAEPFRAAAPTVVVSAAVGGIILGYEVARALGIKSIFVEKENGRAILRRDFALDSQDRALIVEDVVTTGASLREVIDLVRSAGASISGIAILVRRAQAEFGVPTVALLDLPLASFEPSECPQCASDIPLTVPGSRFLQ